MADPSAHGVRITWEPGASPGDPFIGIADLDRPGAEHSPKWTWRTLAAGAGFSRAGAIYQQECEWDAPPGAAGVWLAYVRPDATGSAGNLIGFAVLYDRDEDGRYETVDHLWTAASWRRAGIATALLAEARSRFPLHHVETPLTTSRRALIQAAAADLVQT